jgi:hypothetical protein
LHRGFGMVLPRLVEGVLLPAVRCLLFAVCVQVMGLEIPMRDLRLMDPALAAWESFAQILVSLLLLCGACTQPSGGLYPWG